MSRLSYAPGGGEVVALVVGALTRVLLGVCVGIAGTASLFVAAGWLSQPSRFNSVRPVRLREELSGAVSIAALRHARSSSAGADDPLVNLSSAWRSQRYRQPRDVPH